MPIASRSRRTGVPRRVRIRILERDSYRCVYCGATPLRAYLDVDHVVPRIQGGTNDPTNLVTACAACNGGKGGTPLSLPSGVVPGALPPEPPRIRPHRSTVP